MYAYLIQLAYLVFSYVVPCVGCESNTEDILAGEFPHICIAASKDVQQTWQLLCCHSHC